MDEVEHMKGIQKEEKRYRLNKDFEIVCSTEFFEGNKKYSIAVEVVSLPFLCTLEDVRGLTDPNIANDLFKKFKTKYKEGINLWH